MDKVIIDEIDVSECIYYDDGICCNKDVMSLDCENTDCYYKQLKRLEQENKELRQIRNDTPDIQQPYVIMYRNLKKELHNLQAENERLKNSLEICQGLCKTLEKAKANEYNHWFNRCCEINTECDKYRQSLQEIKEIAEYSIMHNDNLNSNYQLILQIITKAEEENE